MGSWVFYLKRRKINIFMSCWSHINPLRLICTKRVQIKFSTFFFKSSYLKCGLKCFRFLSTFKIEDFEKIDFLKNLQENGKWILLCFIGLIFKYKWWIPMRIKIMTITLLMKILEIKKEFLEIGPFRKMAKTFFSIKDIIWSFYTNFLDINA